MNTAEQIYHSVRPLPEPLAAEVLDFVSFLKERHGLAETSNLMAAQAQSLEATWANDADEVWNVLPAV